MKTPGDTSTAGVNRQGIPRFKSGQTGISAAHLNMIVEAATQQQRIRIGGTKIVNLPGQRIVSPLRP